MTDRVWRKVIRQSAGRFLPAQRSPFARTGYALSRTANTAGVAALNYRQQLQGKTGRADTFIEECNIVYAL
jgi:hypothetical protein